METQPFVGDYRLRQFAKLCLSALVVAMGLVMLAASLRGIELSVAWPAAALTLGLFAALTASARRFASRPADSRLALALASLLSIFIAGSAGGVISLLGQTFALPLIDPSLAAADRIFGFLSLDVVRLAVAVPGLPDVLGALYIATIPIILVSVVALSLLGRVDRVWELCAAFALCMLVATLFSLFVPAAGAFEYLKMPASVGMHLPDKSGVYHLAALHELRGTDRFEINCFRLQGIVTFPSFHTAMAAMTAAAWRDDRLLRWPMLAFNLVVIVSTIPIGGHYLIDLPGGLACWAIVFWTGRLWVRRPDVSSDLRAALA